MLFAAIVFFVAALVAAGLGYIGVAGAAAETGLVLFVVFGVVCALLAGIGALAINAQEKRGRRAV
jgi:uncharacterized membrane protein YtjA (UPF0391 family)